MSVCDAEMQASMLLIFLLHPSFQVFWRGLQTLPMSRPLIYPELWARSELNTITVTSFPGHCEWTYDIGPVQSVFVPVPSITLADGGAGAAGGAEVHLGLWLPVIEGCDYSSTENLSLECQVPVIAEIGPYYSDGDVDADTCESFGTHAY